MNEREGKELDQYFKDGLTPVALTEVDEGWEEMKTMLQQRSKGRDYNKLRIILGSIAAMLLVVFTYFIATRSDEKKQQSLAKNKTEVPLKVADQPGQIGQVQSTTGQPAAREQQQRNVVAKRLVPGSNASPVEDKTSLVEDKMRQDVKTENVAVMLATNNPLKENKSQQSQEVKKERLIAGQNNPKEIVKDQQPEQVIAATKEEMGVKEPAKSEKPDRKVFKPGFALTFSIAPDMSGVNTVKNDRLGFGAGVLLSYALSPKFSVATGVMYAQKIYSTAFANYKPAGNYHLYYQPDDVDANCSVLDIPINVSYNIVSKGNNNLSVGTGLSSYLMLKEKYNYQYKNNYAYSKGIKHFEVDNENQHYLGVANLEVKYERTIMPGLAIGVSPYLKMPLTKIGYGKVDLQSTGVAFSVKTELRSFKKK